MLNPNLLWIEILPTHIYRNSAGQLIPDLVVYQFRYICYMEKVHGRNENVQMVNFEYYMDKFLPRTVIMYMDAGAIVPDFWRV